MAITTFTAAQVLTAAQMNAVQSNDYNQTVNTSVASYVLIASDKGTKRVMNSASATTITVNTSLFAAGDTLTILNIAAGVCTVTAGTATVSTTGSLALVQNAGGTLYFTSAGVSVFQADGVAASTGGLVAIVPSSVTLGGGSSTTSTNGMVTFTTATTSVLLNGVFSSTYNSYRIISASKADISTHAITARLSVGGTPSTATKYQSNLISTIANAASGENSALATSFAFYAQAASLFNTFNIDVINPFLADVTRIGGSLMTGSSAGVSVGGNVNYINTDSTSFDGFQILLNSSATGTISVFGYNK